MLYSLKAPPHETQESEGKQIVAVDIQRSTERPYYIAKKGLRPEGVYVRQGYSSVPATDSAIRRMIIATDGDSFEEMRSLEQNLTFNTTKREFVRRNIPTANRLLKKMTEKNLLLKSGRGNTTKYVSLD